MRQVLTVLSLLALAGASSGEGLRRLRRAELPSAETTRTVRESFVARKTPNDSARPVVLELFTSEGCSSCPPAESELASLVRNADAPGLSIIPLAFHVTYWDELGWRDRYGDTLFTVRQRAYDGDGLKTPDRFLNGVASAWSPDQLRTSAQTMPYTITLGTSRDDGKPALTMTSQIAANASGHAVTGDRLEWFLAVTEDSLVSRPNAGENNGAVLRHVGVVRAFQLLGAVGGVGATRTVRLPTVRGLHSAHAHVVVWLQHAGPGRLGPIVGAASLPWQKVAGVP